MNNRYFPKEQREKLEELCKKVDLFNLHDIASASCARWFDNGGSTCLEIFENGIEFMIKFIERREKVPESRTFEFSHDGEIFYFIGTYEELVKKFSEVEIGGGKKED